jgi:hypothetical protein
VLITIISIPNIERVSDKIELGNCLKKTDLRCVTSELKTLELSINGPCEYAMLTNCALIYEISSPRNNIIVMKQTMKLIPPVASFRAVLANSELLLLVL